MSLEKFNPEEIRKKSAEFESAPLGEILRWAWETHGERAAVGTSFQGAGLVVMHTASSLGYGFPCFTLDTGLLFAETLALKADIEKRLGIVVESIVPEQTVDQQAAEHGPELWKHNPDLCCGLRKVLPLQNKLATLDVWITGVRRQQSSAREAVGILELYHFDVLRDRYIIKVNPMANWSREQVEVYLAEHRLPRNALVNQGYRSIGCWPCTRPIAEGDSERAGRWTGFNKSECGIHTFLGNSI